MARSRFVHRLAHSTFLAVCWLLANDVRIASAAVQCTKSICPKDKRAVRRAGAPKLWVFGCNMTANQSLMHECCVEKEICTRTCDMPWSRCARHYERCVERRCGADDACYALADDVGVLIQGGDSHFEVCKRHRDAQQALCECQPSAVARDTATERLRAFYAAFSPGRLDEQGNVKDVEAVWKKWRGREPELFFELTRKYSAQAVEVRPWPAEDVARWMQKEASDLRKAEEEAEVLRQVQEERELAAKRFAEEQEAIRKAAEEKKARLDAERQERALRRAEHEQALKERREKLKQLRAKKDAAVKAEDFLRAKEISAQLAALDAALTAEVLAFDRRSEAPEEL